MKNSCLLQHPWHHIKHTPSSPSSHKTELSPPLFCFWLHSSFHNRDLLSYFPFPFFLPQCQVHTCKKYCKFVSKYRLHLMKVPSFRRSLAFFTHCFHKIGVQQQPFLMSQMNDQETFKDGRKKSQTNVKAEWDKLSSSCSPILNETFSTVLWKPPSFKIHYQKEMADVATIIPTLIAPCGHYSSNLWP